MNSAALPLVGENSESRWFVMRAYKCEQKAEHCLQAENVEYFIPKHCVIRVYHGVKSKRFVPVIPSLVFVRATHGRIVDFKKRHNFLQFAMWEKSTGIEYIIVPDYQMKPFIRVASQLDKEVTFYTPEEIDLSEGTRVRIHGGELDGVEGTFVRVQGKRNRRVVVMLDGIMAVATEVHPDIIEVIE